MSDRVLIVDDDENVRMVLREVVSTAGLEPVAVAGGREALGLLADEAFALILLDINMPGMDGFQVLERLRSQGNSTPVIMVSARQDDPDVLRALGMGADDYITKPFNPVILSAKAKALIRRSNLQPEGAGAAANVVSAPPFTYDLSTLTLCKNGQPLDLTARENSLAKLFVDNPRRVFPVDVLYEMVWRDDLVDENAVRVYINRLRGKLEDDPSNPRYIVNIRGLGYKFVPDQDA
ncbi:MAG: response regulator transcription factor [Coriobacteriia bacterium]|nr:response regulator transcription factor [Coriobacteriia bacterium]